jgi:hypothetical protein
VIPFIPRTVAIDPFRVLVVDTAACQVTGDELVLANRSLMIKPASQLMKVRVDLVTPTSFG